MKSLKRTVVLALALIAPRPADDKPSPPPSPLHGRDCYCAACCWTRD